MVWLSGGDDDDDGLSPPGGQDIKEPGYPKPLLWNVSPFYLGGISLAPLRNQAPRFAHDPGQRNHPDSFAGFALGQMAVEVIVTRNRLHEKLRGSYITTGSLA